VREELGREVGILNPHRQTTSRVLAKRPSFVKQISMALSSRAGSRRSYEMERVKFESLAFGEWIT
jgi:hypothetical protein